MSKHFLCLKREEKSFVLKGFGKMEREMNLMNNYNIISAFYPFI
jgi:hypothetical protein